MGRFLVNLSAENKHPLTSQIIPSKSNTLMLSQSNLLSQVYNIAHGATIWLTSLHLEQSRKFRECDGTETRTVWSYTLRSSPRETKTHEKPVPYPLELLSCRVDRTMSHTTRYIR